MTEAGPLDLREHAARYVDSEDEADVLAGRVAARLSQRLRRAATGLCEVCGRPIAARQATARTCSDACKQKKYRRSV